MVRREINKGRIVSPVDSEANVSANYEVDLVVRLVLDQQALLQRGELLDAKSRSIGRFVTLAGLDDVVPRWFERAQADVARTRSA